MRRDEGGLCAQNLCPWVKKTRYVLVGVRYLLGRAESLSSYLNAHRHLRKYWELTTLVPFRGG